MEIHSSIFFLVYIKFSVLILPKHISNTCWKLEKDTSMSILKLGTEYKVFKVKEVIRKYAQGMEP